MTIGQGHSFSNSSTICRGTQVLFTSHCLKKWDRGLYLVAKEYETIPTSVDEINSSGISTIKSSKTVKILLSTNTLSKDLNWF